MTKDKIKEVKKELAEYTQSKPTQLELFEVDDQNQEKFSHTVELYDQLPKYQFGGVKREKGKFVESLPILERDFKNRGQDYKLSIVPAAIINRKSGKTIHYYPSQREELIEDALRRLAAAKKKGIYLDNDAGVKFTLYELQQELQKMGHGYNIAQIKESIEVCNSSMLKITSKHGNEISMASSIFPFVGMDTSDEIKNGKNRVVVMFHPLVTKSIDENTYRLINYQKLMSYKMALSRYLHKRISHNFTQASATNPYTIKMSNLVRDSGMKEYGKKILTLNQVIKSLDEMVKVKTLSNYEIERDLNGRKIIDATFNLNVSNEFISEIKKANKAKNDVLEYISGGEYSEKIANVEAELKEHVYGLTNVVILNILSKIKTKDDFIIINNALAAAKEFIESKPSCNAAATTRAAIKEGWKPKSQKDRKKIIEYVAEVSQPELDLEPQTVDRGDEWKKVRGLIKQEFGDESWNKWLVHLELYRSYEAKIIMSAKSKFLRDWIKREYLPQIEKIWQGQGGEIKEVSVIYIE